MRQQNDLSRLIGKIDLMIEQIGDKSPHSTTDGIYDDMRHDWWTSGFWPGILWIMYDLTGKPHYCHQAWDWDQKIEQCLVKKSNLHHDVGFQFLPTSVIKYRITGDKEARRRGLQAAVLLAGRFNIAGNFIRAWNTPENAAAWNYLNTGWSIIDSMMNISLLFWAAGEIGDPRFKHIAVAHADTVIRHFVHANGSVCHICSFDPETGGFIESIGGQGHSPESAWSRGAAWALYGLANTFRYTGEQRYLEAAQKVADFFIRSVEDDHVPIWDFAFRGSKTEPRDTSAGAIAASGLLELSELAAEQTLKKSYSSAADSILQSLSDNYGTWNERCEQGILKSATGHKPNGQNVNVSLIYGDFFFVEALAKLAGWKHRIF